MKKIIVLFCMPLFARSQNDSAKLFQQIRGGLIVATVATTDFSGGETPFTLGHNLLANVTILTPKTFHSVLYGFGNNTLQSLNGYFLPKGWDVYLLYIQSLKNTGQYAACGIEKMMRVEQARFFLFAEVGSNLRGTPLLSFGVLMSFQNKIWSRR